MSTAVGRIEAEAKSPQVLLPDAVDGESHSQALAPSGGPPGRPLVAGHDSHHGARFRQRSGASESQIDGCRRGLRHHGSSTLVESSRDLVKRGQSRITVSGGSSSASGRLRRSDLSGSGPRITRAGPKAGRSSTTVPAPRTSRAVENLERRRRGVAVAVSPVRPPTPKVPIVGGQWPLRRFGQASYRR